jgi:hypothetical protein
MAVMATRELIPILPSVRAFLDRSPGLLINGEWRPAVVGETFVTENPATGEPLSTVMEQYTELKAVWVKIGDA